MSTRSFDEPDVISTYPATWADCYGVETNAAYPVTTTVRRGAKTGAVTPFYHRKVKEGDLLPPNWYYRWDYLGRRRPGAINVHMSCTPFPGPGTGVAGGASITAPLWGLWNGESVVIPDDCPHPWDGVNTDALIIAAMADVLPDLDALTTALEARKTIQMVVSARSEAKRLIREALRGGKHTAKAAADAWLSWRYGWQQLGRDVQNCVDLLNDPLMPIVVTGQSGESQSWHGTSATSSISWLYDGSQTIDYELDASYRGRVVAVWSGKPYRVVADPAISGWETIPYSWVADWFVNVGDVLKAWKVALNVTRLHASLGYQYTLKSNLIRTGTAIAPWLGSFSSFGSETYQAKCRLPTSIPTLVPSINVQLTTPRLLDAVSLLTKSIL